MNKCMYTGGWMTEKTVMKHKHYTDTAHVQTVWQNNRQCKKQIAKFDWYSFLLLLNTVTFWWMFEEFSGNHTFLSFPYHSAI